MPSAQIELSRVPYLQPEEWAVDELARIADFRTVARRYGFVMTAIPAAFDAFRKANLTRDVPARQSASGTTRSIQCGDGHLRQRYGMCGVD